MRAARAGMNWCPHCDITAPPEHKRCVHCGNRLASEASEVVLAHGFPAGGVPEVVLESAGAGPELEAEIEAEPEEAQARTATVRRGMNVVWAVLVVATIAYRACTS